MQALADRVISEIAAIDRISGNGLTIGASVGIVHHRRHSDFDAPDQRARTRRCTQ
ncbi:MAG: hypothetical protein R2710_26640 [Acidimicrobiales bacterium]